MKSLGRGMCYYTDSWTVAFNMARRGLGEALTGMLGQGLGLELET